MYIWYWFTIAAFINDQLFIMAFYLNVRRARLYAIKNKILTILFYAFD